MSKQVLIKQLRKRNPKLSNSICEEILNIFCKSIEKALINGQTVELRGFGTFSVKNIKEKFSARNPATGKLIYIPEKKRVRFKSSKKFKELINKWKN